MNIDPFKFETHKLTQENLNDVFYYGTKSRNIITISNVNKPVLIESYDHFEEYSDIVYKTYPLNYAMEYGNINDVKYLIKLGANVNAKNYVIRARNNNLLSRYSTTPLGTIVSIFQNIQHLRIIYLLLENGAKVNIRNSMNLNALEIFISDFRNQKDWIYLFYLLLESSKIPNNIKLINLINKNKGNTENNIEIMESLIYHPLSLKEINLIKKEKVKEHFLKIYRINKAHAFIKGEQTRKLITESLKEKGMDTTVSKIPSKILRTYTLYHPPRTSSSPGGIEYAKKSLKQSLRIKTNSKTKSI